jgi:hypothetical protein
MIVITRNGQTTVLTGWRAWLVGTVAFIVSFVLLALFTFLALGIAFTIGAVLLIIVPLAIGFALLASVFAGRTR